MKITDRQYQEAAKRIHHVEGECEVDMTTESPKSNVSRSDGGAYVVAWVWISDEDFEQYKKEYTDGDRTV